MPASWRIPRSPSASSRTCWAYLDLVEAAKHYPCIKKAWVEFLGEPGGERVGRVEAA
jgi:hypothetical protein